MNNPFWSPIKKAQKSNPSNFFNLKPKPKHTITKPFFTVNLKSLKGPVNLNTYPVRTKTEIKLIDKNPFGDKDKDKVPNIFDCKPLNKKKQAFILRQDISQRLFGDKDFGTKTRPHTKRRKQIRQMVDTIVKKDWEEKQSKDSRFLKKRNEEGELGELFVPYKDKRKIPRMRTKLNTEKDIVMFFEKHPHLIQQAEKYSWVLKAPRVSLISKELGSFESPETVDEGLKGKPKVIKIFSAIEGKKKDVGGTIVHELEHGEQELEDYWAKKRGKEKKEIIYDAAIKLNKEKAAKLIKDVDKELVRNYREGRYWAPISGKFISDFNLAKEEIKQNIEKNYSYSSPEEKLEIINRKIEETAEEGKPYYVVYSPKYTRISSKNIALKKIKDDYATKSEYKPLRTEHIMEYELPYKKRPSEIEARRAGGKYKMERKALSGAAAPQVLKSLDFGDTQNKKYEVKLKDKYAKNIPEEQDIGTVTVKANSKEEAIDKAKEKYPHSVFAEELEITEKQFSKEEPKKQWIKHGDAELGTYSVFETEDDAKEHGNSYAIDKETDTDTDSVLDLTVDDYGNSYDGYSYETSSQKLIDDVDENDE